MRSAFVRALHGLGVLIFVVAVTAVSVFADDRPPGTEPPQARIQIPVGVTSPAEEAVWDLFLVWLQARIQIPVG